MIVNNKLERGCKESAGDRISGGVLKFFSAGWGGESE